MKSLFAYGSLQFPEVIYAVIGRSPNGVPARLPGYRRGRLRGRSFPGVTAEANAVCPGVLYRSLTRQEWVLLDAFEDDFYQRLSLPVFAGDDREEFAEVYVVEDSFKGLLLTGDWDPEGFRQHDLKRFLQMLVNG
jgi:gamma-glutamylcyclotransferase (GGCT)/AIG2-like uncharacterized protein YtfP